MFFYGEPNESYTPRCFADSLGRVVAMPQKRRLATKLPEYGVLRNYNPERSLVRLSSRAKMAHDFRRGDQSADFGKL